MSSNYVTFTDVVREYHNGHIVRAADGISFSLDKGKLSVIVGPSGAGKTTVLNILGGMDSATTGAVSVDDRDITRLSKREVCTYRRDDVGFVFQFYNLIPNLTALENVELASQIRRTALNPRSVLNDVGLGDRLGNFPAQLSGGEQQRVAIARAITKNPKLLLCDEPTPETLNGFFNLYSPGTGEKVQMTSRSVLVTEKLARIMGVGLGGNFTITYSDGRAYTAEITGIVDNYIQHFIYMSPDIYMEMLGEKVYPNSVLIFYEDGREFAVTLLENSDVRAIIHNDDVKSQVGDSTDALGIVTIVLIVLACALALVVLFNLTNINISERIRELATIKVLGFYDAEMALYIYRENGIVTLLGMILGIIGGILLHGFVLTTVEIDILKFPKLIYPQSYIITVVLSLIFAVFVNLVMSRKLTRIDMVESLKNVE